MALNCKKNGWNFKSWGQNLKAMPRPVELFGYIDMWISSRMSTIHTSGDLRMIKVSWTLLWLGQ